MESPLVGPSFSMRDELWGSEKSISGGPSSSPPRCRNAIREQITSLDQSDPDRAEPGHRRMPCVFLRILLWMSRPFASRGQDLVDLAGDIALQATYDLGF